jgi:hypothetical protein
MKEFFAENHRPEPIVEKVSAQELFKKGRDLYQVNLDNPREVLSLSATLQKDQDKLFALSNLFRDYEAAKMQESGVDKQKKEELFEEKIDLAA